MGSCRYFRKDSRTIQSDEKLSHQQTPHVQVRRTFWCTHKHSPVLTATARTFGGGSMLKCGGDLEKCQVPPEKFDDQ